MLTIFTNVSPVTIWFFGAMGYQWLYEDFDELLDLIISRFFWQQVYIFQYVTRKENRRKGWHLKDTKPQNEVVGYIFMMPASFSVFRSG